jgi:hypothetical protein
MNDSVNATKKNGTFGYDLMFELIRTTYLSILYLRIDILIIGV